MPDAMAPSKPGLGCAGAGCATFCETSRSFLSWATSALRCRSLSSVEITLSSERASSAWLAGDGAEAASAAEAPEAADAGVAVALLIRLCRAGITGVPAPAAWAAAGIHPMLRISATHTVSAHAPNHAATRVRTPRPPLHPI